MHGARSILGEVEPDDALQFDSPFENAVYDFLKTEGYDIATQVGCSGYRINMAIRHPMQTGCYAIGIECDGTAYHLARTARERDRLRQAVLEDMGWIMYRVWSTDWIKDDVNEKAKLIDAIEKAINNCEIAPQTDPSSKRMTEYLDVSRRPATQQKFPHSRYFGHQALDIPISDYALVMLSIIKQSYGIDREELYKSVVLAYGWKRRGSNINAMLDQAFEHLFESGQISVEIGKIQCCNVEDDGNSTA
jgi:very-short-patch-repair endonuclease